MKHRLLDGTALDLILDPSRRYLLLDENDEETGGNDGGDGGDKTGEGDGGDGGRKALTGGDEGDKGGDKGDQDPPDWRASIADDDLRKVADRFNSPTEAIKAISDLRKRESTSVRLPGDEATDEEVASFRKSMGIPDEPTGYEWPEIPEGTDNAEAMEAERGEWSAFFHENNFTKTQAEQAMAKYQELAQRNLAQQIENDKAFAAEQDEALRKEWPGAEFDKNKEFANRAANELFGEDLETVRHMETKDGRFVMDNAILMKALAKYGREMGEGNMGLPMSDTERDSLATQIDDLRDQRREAMQKGDAKKANAIQAQIQELYAKRDGNQPVVGKETRAA